ncbi:hypothetical protein SOVF_025910 [Spinacia oleracea]|nr:hypothetical protein SOVF_025910 [Spinacia oleracea]
MNGIQLNGKPRGSEKPVPGCLGRMVNLFDLTSSMSGNRLLTDKPYNDGSSLSRSRSDVSRMSSIAIDEMEDKVMVSDLRRSSSNRKPNGTPVKMLIAQEMSKDLETIQKPPNVVAKLMGLDVIPQQQPDLASQRIHSRIYSRNSHSEIPVGYYEEEHGFCDVHPHRDQNEYKDIYEIWQQSQRTNCRRDKSPQKGRIAENMNDKKLALIRQKFVEAKRLATDEKLRQTKEFQEALDVLSSNGDLFLKVLQEPNSLFSQQFYIGDSISPSPETKRITVLRPSKMVTEDKFAKRNENQSKKQVSLNQVNVWENQHSGFPPTISSWKVSDSPIQPTRIVVLKPSPVKPTESQAVISSTPSSPRVLPSESFFEEPEDEEAREAREVAKEITQQMRENLAGHRRDETLLSSVFSNGYTGDESSFEKSENEFAAENLSDSEVMSPTSRHSWDYVNRFGSPFSSSSFSRASYSPESSVCREAKKRLSERWAMMASNGGNNNNNNNNNINSNHGQRHIRRSSSTLGEMLALSEIKNSEICEVEDNNNKDEDPRGSTPYLNSNMDVIESGDSSPRNLLRSKSVPVSSTAYGERLNVEVNNPALCKAGSSKEIIKAKVSKTSFTGKVTSLFFSRNKKSKKEKSSKSVANDESQLATAETPGSLTPPGRTSNDHSEVVLSPTSRLHSGNVMIDLNDTILGQSIPSQQAGTSAIQGENQEQPSPISVLQTPFEEDDSTLLGCSRSIDPNLHGEHIPVCLGKSNLIDKSPPIGSIARTLSWEEPFAETATNYPMNSPFMSLGGAEDDEVEYLYLVQSLLTIAGLNDDEGQVGSHLSRWHSPDCPLDPLLRDKYIDLSAKEPLHEARRRQLRSRRKLIFDCVNAALVDITGFRTSNGYLVEGETLTDKVWAWIKELLPGEVKFLSVVDGGDNHCLVEKLVRKEVIGKGWNEQIRFQVDSIGKEIEGKLLEQLVEESLLEWTPRR